jgi:glucosamine-6-phosphate deaminase
MTMNIRIFQTPREAGIYAAALAEQVILHHEQPVLGLATGSTPIPFYEGLINLHRSGLDLSHIVTINLDEYIGLASSNKQSYHYYMKSNLLSHVNINLENVHIPNGMADDLQAECTRYDDCISRYPIDLQLLGIGLNGHIGFNEPDDMLLSKTHVVILREETIESNSRFFVDKSEVPARAISMGIQSILQAKRIVLMAFGKEKADIVYETLMGNIRTDVPASILKLHQDVTVVLDTESAARLMQESK